MKRKAITKNVAKKIIRRHTQDHRVYPKYLPQPPSFEEWLKGDYDRIDLNIVESPEDVLIWLFNRQNKERYHGGNKFERIITGDYTVIKKEEYDDQYSGGEDILIQAVTLPLWIKKYSAWRGKTDLEIWLTENQKKEIMKEYNQFLKEEWKSNNANDKKETLVIELTDDFYILERDDVFEIECCCGSSHQYEMEERRIRDKNGNDIFYFLYESDYSEGEELEKVFYKDKLIYLCKNKYSAEWQEVGFGRHSELFEEKHTEYIEPYQNIIIIIGGIK